jgi:hypothetical protein
VPSRSIALTVLIARVVSRATIDVRASTLVATSGRKKAYTSARDIERVTQTGQCFDACVFLNTAALNIRR